MEANFGNDAKQKESKWIQIVWTELWCRLSGPYMGKILWISVFRDLPCGWHWIQLYFISIMLEGQLAGRPHNWLCGSVAWIADGQEVKHLSNAERHWALETLRPLATWFLTHLLFDTAAGGDTATASAIWQLSTESWKERQPLQFPGSPSHAVPLSF